MSILDLGKNYHNKRLGQLREEMLEQMLAELPPKPTAQPIYPASEGKTLPEMIHYEVVEHQRKHGIRSTIGLQAGIPPAGYFETEPLHYRPGFFRQIYRRISGLSNPED